MSEMFKYVQLRHMFSGVLLLLTTGQLMVDQMPDLISPNRCRSFSILRLGDMAFKASNQKFIIKHQNYVWKAPMCRENQPFEITKTVLPWHSGIMAMFDSKVSKNNNIKEESFIGKKLLSRKDSLCNFFKKIVKNYGQERFLLFETTKKFCKHADFHQCCLNKNGSCWNATDVTSLCLSLRW